MNILLTTAISYTNGAPHIGHLYESVLSDFFKNLFIICGHDTKLLTGTDEHGKKIQDMALSKNITPLELCNTNSALFKKLNDDLHVKYDYFIRTTEDLHKELVSNTINISDKNNDIYLSEYTGWYNVREECFLTDADAKSTNYKDPVTNIPYEKINEESYFFKLSQFKDFIRHFLTNSKNDIIIPSNKNAEILNRLSNELKDLSISRISFNWGIPFPNNKKHIIYVWFDALLNYITGKNILYPNCNNLDIYHLIGKDILWFHSVIYPAILKSSKLDDFLPKRILVHGFILDKNGNKMSKSLGNTVDVNYLIDKYPINAIRYYFIHETNIGEDINFSEDRLKELYNNNLIKDFGNLFQRLHNLLKPIQLEINDLCSQQIINIRTKLDDCKIFLNKFAHSFDFNEYRNYITTILKNSNQILTQRKPWTINGPERFDIMFNSLIELYLVHILLYPIIPDKINELCGYIGWETINKNSIDNTNLKINISLNEKIKAFQII
jgi:methionyl-tRNA synthetase